MTKNINFDAHSDDDTEGHMRVQGEAPSMRAYGEAPSAAEQDDTEGHFRIADEAPAMNDDEDDTDDDTQGHFRVADQAPGITGSLSVDPKTQS